MSRGGRATFPFSESAMVVAVRIASLLPSATEIVCALGGDEIGRRLVAELRERVAAIGRRAGERGKPRVVTIEWIAPVMIGGMWMPELVSLAGGTPLVTEPGQHAPTLDASRLAALDPDVVVVKPCGFSLPRTLEEVDVLRERLPRAWHAHTWLADGNAYFNRPGPRIVESLEI